MNHEKLKKELLKKNWKKTTTFKIYPHSYSLDFEWDDKETFKEVWNFIKENGEMRIFFRRKYYYYKVDNYEYWSMYTSDNKQIINRRPLDNV